MNDPQSFSLEEKNSSELQNGFEIPSHTSLTQQDPEDLDTIYLGSGWKIGVPSSGQHRETELFT